MTLILSKSLRLFKKMLKADLAFLKRSFRGCVTTPELFAVGAVMGSMSISSEEGTLDSLHIMSASSFLTVSSKAGWPKMHREGGNGESKAGGDS